MTAKELRAMTLRVPDDAEVKVLVGPEEDFDSYKDAVAMVAGDFTGDGPVEYLLIDQQWEGE